MEAGGLGKLVKEQYRTDVSLFMFRQSGWWTVSAEEGSIPRCCSKRRGQEALWDGCGLGQAASPGDPAAYRHICYDVRKSHSLACWTPDSPPPSPKSLTPE